MSLRILVCTLLACWLAADVTAAQLETIAIKGATVIDVRSGAQQRRDILIRDGRIAELRAAGRLRTPTNARIIDGTGQYAIPGLWDMHVHLTSTPEFEDRILALYVANGVTSVRDTGGGVDAVLAVRKRADEGSTAAPRIWWAGSVIDGSPPVRISNEPAGKEAHAVADTPAQAIAVVDSLAQRGVDFIKAYEMLRPEVLTALIARAHHHGLSVTGHIPLRTTTQHALDAGLDGIEHLRGMEFDCARDPQRLLADRVRLMDAHADERGMQLRRRVHATVRPGAFASQDSAACAALIRQFVKRGTWHTPTLQIVAFRSLGYHGRQAWRESWQYLPAALQPVWRERLAEYTDESKYDEWRTHGEWAIATLGQMHAAGVRILAGTDSPGLIFMPGFTLHDELAALVHAGLSPLAALQAATLNPARYFNAERESGVIERGRFADIVLLAADPLADITHSRRITAVVVKGRAYDRAALDRLLGEFRQP